MRVLQAQYLPADMPAHTVVTVVTNDGYNLKDKKQHTSHHGMLMRVVSFDRGMSQDVDFICPISIHACTESNESFLEMFVYDKKFAEQWKAFFADKFGFKKHLCLLCADGAAQGHHMGTSSHAGTCGCNHCTVHKGFKHLIDADYNRKESPYMAALLGVPRDKTTQVPRCPTARHVVQQLILSPQPHAAD